MGVGRGVGLLRAGLLGSMAGAAVLLAACARDPYVNVTLQHDSVGEWRIERQIDRVTGAPISNSILTTQPRFQRRNLVPAAGASATVCFKEHPAVVIAFAFKIGSTRNAEVGYRFDEKPGHEPRVRIVDDYKTVLIEDPNEVAQFAGEMATSDGLYVRIRSLTAAAHQRGIQGRRRAGGDRGRLRRLPADARRARERIAARRSR